MSEVESMSTVYIVTSGGYDEYRIEGVFSTTERAQRFIDDVVAVESAGIESGRQLYPTPYSIEDYQVDDLSAGTNDEDGRVQENQAHMTNRKCKACGRENSPIRKTCVCGAVNEGWAINNVTGKYGYRNADGSFTVYDLPRR